MLQLQISQQVDKILIEDLLVVAQSETTTYKIRMIDTKEVVGVCL